MREDKNPEGHLDHLQNKIAFEKNIVLKHWKINS